MRGKFVYEGGKFVPLQREVKARPTVITDEMPALKHPGNRQYYTSRSKYNEVTKAYGYEEAAGEPDKYWAKPELTNDDELEQDILQAEKQLEYGEGISEEERELCKIQEEAQEWQMNNSK
jgi:hypothetical protein